MCESICSILALSILLYLLFDRHKREEYHNWEEDLDNALKVLGPIMIVLGIIMIPYLISIFAETISSLGLSITPSMLLGSLIMSIVVTVIVVIIAFLVDDES